MKCSNARRAIGATATLMTFGLGAAIAHAQIIVDPAVNYLTGQGPSGVAIGDFDADGDADLATSTDQPDKINVLLNNGAGVFTAGPVIPLPASSSPDDLKAGDLDGDGDIDLAVILSDLNQVRVALNTGGSFALGSSIAIGANATGMAIADIDGDKDLDLAVANRDSNTATVLVNAGNATFAPTTLTTALEPRAAAFGSFNGDALLDVVVTNHDSRSLSVFSQTSGGAFTLMATLSTGTQLRPQGVVAADVDNDGDDDIVAATSSDTNGNFASVYRNLGGTFSGMNNFASGGLQASGVVAADLDCDNLIDLAVTNQDSSSVGLLRNLGAASFAGAALSTVDTRPNELAAADLDGDGDLEVVTANRDANSLSVMMNQSCAAPVVGDVTGDGLVNADDLIAVILAWGACPPPPATCPADVAPAGGDGVVNADDLTVVILNWS